MCNSPVLSSGMKILLHTVHWVGDSISWPKELFGNFGDRELIVSRFGRRVNGDSEPFCSVDCTLGLLMRNPQI